MKKHVLVISLMCLFFMACTECTECEYEYILPSSMDTVTGSDQFCGANSTVKDFEAYYKSNKQEEAGFYGVPATVTCTHSKKQ